MIRHIFGCVFLWEDFMIGKIIGIVLLIFIALFAICSCKVASWADQEMEEDLRKREQNEEENL